jgi:hypothetical protein
MCHLIKENTGFPRWCDDHAGNQYNEELQHQSVVVTSGYDFFTGWSEQDGVLELGHIAALQITHWRDRLQTVQKTMTMIVDQTFEWKWWYLILIYLHNANIT